MTDEQKHNLLPHITDNGILSEIASHNKMKKSLGISLENSFNVYSTNNWIEAEAIHLIDNDELLLEIAGQVPYELTYMVAAKLGTQPLLRRLFSCTNSVCNMQDSYDMLYAILKRLVGVNELIDHYTDSPYTGVRMAVFEIISHQYFDVLQSMAMTEPDDHTRERMQGMLDDLTEDRI